MNKQELKSFIQAEIARIERNKNMTEGDVMRIQSHRITLASLEAEPIAVTDKSEVDGLSEEGWVGNFLSPEFKGVDKGDEVYLYTAPPVPVDLASLVPDGITEQDAIDLIISGWNDDFLSGVKWHRAEMLRKIEKLEG